MPDENILETQEVKDAISAAVTSAVTKIEENRDTIIAEKRELTNQLKDATETITSFEGLDIEKVRKMMDAINKSDEAKLISEGKIDDVILARTEASRTQYESEITGKESEIVSLKEQNSSLQNMYEDKLVGDAIRAEAIKQGMLPEAIVDAVSNSNGKFKLDEDGKVIATKPDDFVNNPERFIKSLKESRSYYWPANADFRLNGSKNTGDPTTINERLEEAAGASDFDAYKKLRDAKK